MSLTGSESVATNVAYYRRKAGLTQRQLAERVNCSAAYISRIECRYRGMSVEMLKKLAVTLGISCDALLRESCSGEANIDDVCALLQDCPQQLVEQVENVVRFMKNAWVLRGEESGIIAENGRNND